MDFVVALFCLLKIVAAYAVMLYDKVIDALCRRVPEADICEEEPSCSSPKAEIRPVLPDDVLQAQLQLHVAELNSLQAADELAAAKQGLRAVEGLLGTLEADRKRLRQQLSEAENAVRSIQGTVEKIEMVVHCQICLTGDHDVIFQCGHGTCSQCAYRMVDCPFCRQFVRQRIRIFH